MNKAKWLSAIGLALTSVAGLQGCASTAAQGQPTDQSVAAAKIKDGLTVENLLRWPLEDQPNGIDKVIAGLNRVFQMKPLRASQFSGDGPVQLGDGHILSFALVRKLSGNIDIGLESEPCVSPQRAVEITGAIQDPVLQDAHGIDRGRQYRTERNGVTLRFNTTPITYRCVTTIRIHPVRQEAQ